MHSRGILLLTYNYRQSCANLTPPPAPPPAPPWSWSWPPLRNPSCHHYSSQICGIYNIAVTTRSNRWDSNAETAQTRRRFNFEFQNKNDEDEEEEEEEEEAVGSGILVGIIDNVYIFKVFRSFGWFLPAIILSLLLATGPKAFLLALVVSIGQSVVSLAFEKVGRILNTRKRKSRTKKKPYARSPASGINMKQEQAASWTTRKGKMGYQSWVTGNGGSVKKGGQDASSFGGWDDLDKDNRRRRTGRNIGGSRWKGMEEGRLSRKERKNKTPLLLRLIIAVFPFLGSWTKFL